jgi:transcriptional regulator with GAF, ATPase, and Fis domain
LTILRHGDEVSAAEVARVLEVAAPDGAQNGSGPPTSAAGLTDKVDEFERALILEALDAADGNVAEAARRLQTDRANLYRRMRRLSIPR